MHALRHVKQAPDVDKWFVTWAQAARKPGAANASPVFIQWASSWQPVMNLPTT
jgi:hypothetical protein